MPAGETEPERSGLSCLFMGEPIRWICLILRLQEGPHLCRCGATAPASETTHSKHLRNIFRGVLRMNRCYHAIHSAHTSHGIYRFEAPIRISIAIAVRGSNKKTLINTLLLKSATSNRISGGDPNRELQTHLAHANDQTLDVIMLRDGPDEFVDDAHDVRQRERRSFFT
jgi:hypothetical protein